MKYLLVFVFSLMLTGCGGLSKEEISQTVKKSMQKEFDTNQGFKEYGLIANNVAVFESESGTYKGLATVLYKGQMNKVAIDIVIDGNSVFWEAKPGAFMFIMQQDLQGVFGR